MPDTAILRRPVVPFELIQDLGGGIKIVRRDDPVLWSLASYQDERTYRIMRETTPTISSSIGALNAFLLGFGWRVDQPRSRSRRRGPKAQSLVELADAQLQSLMVPSPNRLTSLPDVLEISTSGFYEGWLPVRATWNTQAFMWNGRWVWGIVELQEQQQENYSFTADPEPRLVELNRFAGLGDTRPPRVIPPDEERAWFIVRAGSTRTPYGRAFLRDLYVPWRILQAFSEWYYRGARNALSGVPVLRESIPSVGSSFINSAPGSVDAGMGTATLSALIAEARQVSRLYEEEGILIIRGGFNFDILDRVNATKGWQEALAYLQDTFVVAIRGETLTSEVGQYGSRAVADVHQATKLSYAQRLARHLEPMFNQIVAYVVYTNEANVDPDDLPLFSFRVHRRSDPERAGFLADRGIKVAAIPLAEEWGIELAEEDAEEGTYLKPVSGRSVDQASDDDKDEKNTEQGRADREQQRRPRRIKPVEDDDESEDQDADEPARFKRRKVAQ